MKKIAIIGGGIAGLSAGCYAQMNGYDAHIYEMHNLPGGLCTAWKRKGYTFDICIHWLEGTSPNSPFHSIWQELGAIQDKKIHYKDVSVRVISNGQIVNFYCDPDKLAKHLKEIAPEDSEMIDELVYTIRKAYTLFNMPLTKAKELFSVIDKLKNIKSFIPFMKFFIKYARMNIDEFAAKFKNPVLQQAVQGLMADTEFTQFFGVPFMIATQGCGFPEGGSLNFAKSIEQRYIKLGGKIHYNSKIEKILVKNNEAVGIKLEDGKEVKADMVISAADGYSTIFKMLDGKFINKKIRNCYETQPTFPTYLQVSIGLDMDLSSNSNLINSIYNFYKLDKPIEIAGKEHTFLSLKNYAFDPTFSPKGKTTLVAGFSCRFENWEKLYQNREKYQKEKKKVERAVIAFLKKIIPNIEDKIEAIDVATPLTIVRYTNNWRGSYMGWANPFSVKISKTLPKLKNFFMVGQWVGGTGVSGAAQSGRDCLEYICVKNKKEFITTKPSLS